MAHSVAMRAHECTDEEWAVRDAALARCTGRYWVVSGSRVGRGGCAGSHWWPMFERLTPVPQAKRLQNRKPRMSPKGAHLLSAQQRLWDILVQQTGTDFVLPQPAAAEA